MIGLGLRKLRTYEKEDLDHAKRYAMDQSVKYVMLKQREAHQQQVKFYLVSVIVKIPFLLENIPFITHAKKLKNTNPSL